MAQDDTIRTSKLLIKIGDGETPEVFSAPCGLTTKALNLTAAVNEFEVDDCADPDAPVWIERVVKSLSAGVSGSGTGRRGAMDLWRTWFLSGEAKNIHVMLDLPAAEGGGTYKMSAVLTTFNTTGESKGLVQAQVDIQSNGEVTFTPAAS